MTHQLVVLGAGYSGLVAAKLAAKRSDAQVTLINMNDRFIERVRMHQLATDQHLTDLPLADLVSGTGIDLIIDRAVAIDTSAQTVRLEHTSKPVPYDTLLYALGSMGDLESVPGAAEHAYTVSTPDQAQRLRSHLRGLEPGEVVTVVGAGLTGIEAATELAESHPGLKVRLLTDEALGAALSHRAQRYLHATCDRLGIEVVEHAQVTEVREDGLVLADGEHLSSGTVVWTAGFRVPNLARESGLAVDRNGRLIVDQTLRSTSHPQVYGVGDAAAAHRPNGQELRMACGTGLPTGQQVARIIADRLAGRTPRPLRYRFVQQCISLGRTDGLIQMVHTDDRPREIIITGRAAAHYKEAVVRATVLVMRHPWIPATV